MQAVYTPRVLPTRGPGPAMQPHPISESESNALVDALYSDAPEPVGIHVSGVLERVNRSFLRLFGYADEPELIGHSVLELVAPSSRADVLDRIALHQPGVHQLYEIRGLRSDGTEFDLEVRACAAVLRTANRANSCGAARRLGTQRDVASSR